jgi:hypothetical protein
MQLKTGDRVRVDGGRGVVEILDAKHVISNPQVIVTFHARRMNEDASH